jgi:hypothetical protein
MRQRKRYARLRLAIAEAGYTLAEVAHEYNVEHGTEHGLKYANWLVPYLGGKLAWRSDIMWWLMDLLKLPHEQLGLYFPKDGIEEE